MSIARRVIEHNNFLYNKLYKVDRGLSYIEVDFNILYDGLTDYEYDICCLDRKDIFIDLNKKTRRLYIRKFYEGKIIKNDVKILVYIFLKGDIKCRVCLVENDIEYNIDYSSYRDSSELEIVIDEIDIMREYKRKKKYDKEYL